MICKLCTLDKNLVDSHIITDSCYAEIYKKFDTARKNVIKPKHRAYKVTLDKTVRSGLRKLPIQTGLKEKLLCSDCEGLLNDRCEKYFNQNWLVSKKLPENLKEKTFVTLSGIDYQKFKLFHLSILFRAGISKLPEFSNVVLGRHEEEIRRMLWDDDPGKDTHYVILANAIIDGSNKIKYDLITAPYKLRLPNGYNGYGFCFAGCEWYYVVDKRKTNHFDDLQLKADGTITLTSVNWLKFLNW